MAESVNSVHRGLAGLFDRDQKRPLLLGLLICLHIVICAASLRVSFPFYRSEYVMYDPAGLTNAIAATAIFCLIAPLFVFTRFSFGYLCGFYLFTMVAGFLWLNSFSKLQYDHVAARYLRGLVLPDLPAACPSHHPPDRPPFRDLRAKLRTHPLRHRRVLSRNVDSSGHIRLPRRRDQRHLPISRRAAVSDCAELRHRIDHDRTDPVRLCVLRPAASILDGSGDARHRDLILSEHVHQDCAVHAGFGCFA